MGRQLRDAGEIWLALAGDLRMLGAWMDMTMLALNNGTRYVQASYGKLGRRWDMHHETARRVIGKGEDMGMWRRVDINTRSNTYEITSIPFRVSASDGGQVKLVEVQDTFNLKSQEKALEIHMEKTQANLEQERKKLSLEEKKKKYSPKTWKPVYSEAFEKAWEEYPRRTGHSKKEADRIWQVLINEHGYEETLLLAQTKKYAAYQKEIGNTGLREKFVPHMSTWLHPRNKKFEANYDLDDMAADEEVADDLKWLQEKVKETGGAT